MSFFRPALVTLYERSGVRGRDARLVHARYGQAYPLLVEQLTQSGCRQHCQALAAVQIADDAFFLPAQDPAFYWSSIRTQQDVEDLVDNVRAAGLCSVALYHQHFAQNVVTGYIDAYARFLDETRYQAERHGLSLYMPPLLALFSQESQALLTRKPMSTLALLFN